MSKSDSIELVLLTVKSLKSSIHNYELAQDITKQPMVGCHIGKEDSKASIIRRCRQAREELLKIMNELE